MVRGIRLAVVAVVVALALPARAFVRSAVPGEVDRYLFWPDRSVELRPSGDEGPGIAAQELRAALERSAEIWSEPAFTDLDLIVGDDASGSDTNLLGDGPPDFENRVVWRGADWPPDLGPDVAAITTVLLESSGALLDADVDLNADGFVWTTTDEPGAIDLESNLTHELGHVIGFDHTGVPSATMFFSTKSGDMSRRDLAETDLDGLCFVYPAGVETPAGTLPDPSPGRIGGGGCTVVPTRTSGPSGVALLAVLALFAAVSRGSGRWYRRARAEVSARRYGRPGVAARRLQLVVPVRRGWRGR